MFCNTAFSLLVKLPSRSLIFGTQLDLTTLSIITAQKIFVNPVKSSLLGPTPSPKFTQLLFGVSIGICQLWNGQRSM